MNDENIILHNKKYHSRDKISRDYPPECVYFNQKGELIALWKDEHEEVIGYLKP
jgi:hypothetical protein